MNKVIIDCDTGEDDALAILLALKNKLPVSYIVSSYGNTSIDNSTRNSADLVYLAKNKSVKIIKGSSGGLTKHPLEKDGVSAVDFVGKNGLCNTVLPASKYNSVIVPDVSLEETITTILKNDGPFDYIVTGPSTNLARLCQHIGSDITKYISNVFVMGGALTTPGNSGPINPLTSKPYAEFNFYCDAKAVDIVLKSKLLITLVSWDLTSKMTVPFSDIKKFTSNTPVGQFCIELMANFFSYYGLSNARNFELNDPLTVIAYLKYGLTEEKKITVIQEGKEYGRSIVDDSGTGIKYFLIGEKDRKEIIEKILSDLEVTQS